MKTNKINTIILNGDITNTLFNSNNAIEPTVAVMKNLNKNSDNITKLNLGVRIASNDKLQGVKGISLPNEFLRVNFITWYQLEGYKKNNVELEKLYNYLSNNNSCFNPICFKSCYNNHLYSFRPNKGTSDLRNLYLLLFHTDYFINSCVTQFYNCRIGRLNISGEINSIIWNVYKQIINKCKHTTFYIYTKNYKFLDTIKHEIPSNLIVNVSVWNNLNSIKKYDFSMFNLYITTSKGKNITVDNIGVNKVNYITTCNESNCLKCEKCFTKNNIIITEIRGEK